MTVKPVVFNLILFGSVIFCNLTLFGFVADAQTEEFSDCVQRGGECKLESLQCLPGTEEINGECPMFMKCCGVPNLTTTIDPTTSPTGDHTTTPEPTTTTPSPMPTTTTPPPEDSDECTGLGGECRIFCLPGSTDVPNVRCPPLEVCCRIASGPV